jgi:hypothetical protein
MGYASIFDDVKPLARRRLDQPAKPFAEYDQDDLRTRWLLSIRGVVVPEPKQRGPVPTRDDLWCMRLIRDGREPTTRDIGDMMGRTAQATRDRLYRLIDRGWIRNTGKPVARWMLTAEGAKMVVDTSK